MVEEGREKEKEEISGSRIHLEEKEEGKLLLLIFALLSLGKKKKVEDRKW